MEGEQREKGQMGKNAGKEEGTAKGTRSQDVKGASGWKWVEGQEWLEGFWKRRRRGRGGGVSAGTGTGQG